MNIQTQWRREGDGRFGRSWFSFLFSWLPCVLAWRSSPQKLPPSLTFSIKISSCWLFPPQLEDSRRAPLREAFTGSVCQGVLCVLQSDQDLIHSSVSDISAFTATSIFVSATILLLVRAPISLTLPVHPSESWIALVRSLLLHFLLCSFPISSPVLFTFFPSGFPPWYFPMDFEAEPGKPPSWNSRPLMLKDFLQDDPHSSSGFVSYPRKYNSTKVRNLLVMDLKDGIETKSSAKLVRSRSRAASATIATLQKASEAVIKAVKHFPLSPVRSQSLDSPKQRLLSRSLSQRLKRRFRSKSQKCESQIISPVRVRDIIRWKSFSEVETMTKSVDFSSSIQTSSTHSSNSSWADSDFSLRFSSSSSESTGENEAVDSKTSTQEKKSSVGEDSMGAATCYRKSKVTDSPIRAENTYEEKEQLSPVSVLEFPEEDEEMPLSSFQRSLANMERTKQQLLQKIRRFESLAELDPVDLEKRIAVFELDCSSSSEDNSGDSEKNSVEEVAEEDYGARELLNLLNSIFGGCQKPKTDRLFLDFFKEGLRNGGNESKEVLLRRASDWSNGFARGKRREVKDDREALVREMEMGGRWKKLKEEEEELALEMEAGVLGVMLDELLIDLLRL